MNFILNFIKKLLFISIVLMIANCGSQLEAPFEGREDGDSNNDLILSWDFANSENYIFFNNEIEFNNGKAQVKTVPLNYTNANQFEAGDLWGLSYSNGFLQIDELTLTNLSEDWTPHWTRLTGYWQVDANWNDSSNLNNDGTTSEGVSIDLMDRQVGAGSGVFDGVNGAVSMADNVGLDALLEDSMTLSLWTKFDSSFDGVFARILSKACFDGSSFTNSSYTMTKSPLNEVGFSISDEGSSFTSTLSESLRSDIWHHIAATYDGSEIKLYINGQLSATTPFTSGMYDSSSDLVLGAINGAGCAGFTEHNKGHLDEVAIWSKAFNAGDISYIYHRQKQKFSGHFDSPTIDTGIDSGYAWNKLEWLTSLPFGKPMPGDVNSDGIADSEFSVQYSQLVGSSGSTTDNNFMSQLLLYYPMDGQLDYDGTTDEVIDSSGLSNHGTANSGNPIPSAQGIYYNSRYFIGAGQSILAANISSPPIYSGSRTTSFWLRIDPVQMDTSEGYNIIYSEGDGIFYDQVGVYNQTHSVAEDRGKVFYKRSNGTVSVTNISAAKVNDGKFHHIVALKDEAVLKIFIDGVLSGAGVTDTTSGAYTSAYEVKINNATSYFSGDIDDFAMWKRALHTVEVMQTYRRGANRIKFLVKTCVDATCNCASFNTFPVGHFDDCDGDGLRNAIDKSDAFVALWKGPTGKGDAYFSELHNNTTIDDDGVASGNIELSHPNLNFADFTNAGLSLSNSRYFKIRLLMESDDESTHCNGRFCSPQLKSMSLGPELKYAKQTTIKNLATFNYNVNFRDFSVIEDGDENCEFAYQISKDGGSTNYYYNGTSWSPITLANEKSSSAEVKMGITRFTEQFPSGIFKFRAFMTSLDGVTNCSIDQIDLTF